jgi:hypothetical protein
MGKSMPDLLGPGPIRDLQSVERAGQRLGKVSSKELAQVIEGMNEILGT